MFSKADGLKYLNAIWVNVPNFSVLDKETVLDIVNDEADSKLPVVVKSINQKVSVRSCGSISTPGRMKTILNVSNNNLVQAIKSVYKSTQSERLHNYLKLKNCTKFEWSIIVQEMITIDKEGEYSGVLVTHNPITHEECLFGEVIEGFNGDVLMNGNKSPQTLEILPTKLYNELKENVLRIQQNIPLHDAIGESKEIEFAIKNGVIWFLQVRAQKLNSNLIVDEESITGEVIGNGQAITKKNAQGQISTSTNKYANKILLLEETDFEDVKAVVNSNGLITRKGGQLSHAASIARDFDIPTIVGVGDIQVGENDNVLLSREGLIYKLN